MNSSINTVLLTGATGFLGSHLLEALVGNKYKVICLKRSHSNTCRIEECLDKVLFYDVDRCGLEEPFVNDKIDAVIHAATKYARQTTDLYDVVETNVLFGTKLIDLCNKYDTKLFVSTDTFTNDGETSQSYLDSYILSKKQFAEWLFLRSNKFKTINMKLQHMYGPRDDLSKFIPWVVSQLAEGRSSLELSPGMQLRDFVFVDDVVRAYLKILECYDNLPIANTYNVGSGVKTTLRDMVEVLRSEVAACRPVNTELRFGALEYRKGEKLDIQTDISAMRELGWEPSFDLRAGMSNTVKYYLH